MSKWFAVGASTTLLLQIPFLGWMLFVHLVNTDYRTPLLEFDSAKRLVKYRGNVHGYTTDDFSKVVVEEFDFTTRSTDDDRIAVRIRATLKDAGKPDEILLQSDDWSRVSSIGEEIAEQLQVQLETKL